MTTFQKKHKSTAPVLSKEARLNIKMESWQESERKFAQMETNLFDLLRQKAELERGHQQSLVARGLGDEGAEEQCSAVESQIAQVGRKIIALEAAKAQQQLVHAELSREVKTMRQEILEEKHQEYLAGLEASVKAKKEQLIANLYAGCALFAELIHLADEAYAADERVALSGHSHFINAGHRFVEEALEDLNLRTTPIIMMERGGFVRVRSSLAIAQRAFAIHALMPPKVT